jgi:AraC-like DNA-binding protein
MEFALHVPKAPLDRHVELLTFYAGFAPDHHREKLIPDGAIQIIVDLTDRPKRLYAGETAPGGTDFRRAWISGMHRRPIVIEAQHQASMLIIRFRPGGALAFVRHDAAALTDAVHPLDDVIGTTSLRDRILAAPTIAEKFAATEGWLLERARGDLALNPSAAYLAARLLRPGQRVRDLAEETGISARHAQNLFRRWIGVTPKQFARITRFKHLLLRLAGGATEAPALDGSALPPPNWAALAADSGYTDQSHLTHEFRALAGMTPGAYAAAYRGLSNYLPITLPK